MSQPLAAFWSVSASEFLLHQHATPQGLTSQDAQHRLARARANLLQPAKRTDTLTLLLAQFKSPIILILLLAAGLSFFLQDPTDALIGGQLGPTVWSSFVLPPTRSHAGEGVP
jgi:Mg2+-importing ATPase